ncbi:TPA: NAD(P)-dependent oxidoreductase [Enterococcus faecium]
MRIACYGVRPNEIDFFEQLNIYHYELSLYEELLTHDNIESAMAHDAVLLRGNCIADEINLAKMQKYGIRYVFTRTVGVNHINLQAAADFGMTVARVPSYSPNAIAELSLTFAMMLLRNTAYTTIRTSFKDFRVDEQMFSREIRNCTVGIIGTGRIGLTEAVLFKGLGAKVIGYDIHQTEAAKKVLTFHSLEELLAKSDIVSIHVPHIPGENDQMINEGFLAQMKRGSILINTAVFANETDVFFRSFKPWEMIPDPAIQQLVELYPRVLITPHVGSNTDEALSNMISTSFENFREIIETGKTKNEVSLPKARQLK